MQIYIGLKALLFEQYNSKRRYAYRSDMNKKKIVKNSCRYPAHPAFNKTEWNICMLALIKVTVYLPKIYKELSASWNRRRTMKSARNILACRTKAMAEAEAAYHIRRGTITINTLGTYFLFQVAMKQIQIAEKCSQPHLKLHKKKIGERKKTSSEYVCHYHFLAGTVKIRGNIQ